MKETYLDFEGDVRILDEEIERLAQKKDAGRELAALKRKRTAALKKLYKGLTPWQRCLVARHPCRPYMLDYVEAVFTDFVELHGDRTFADDMSIVGGLARIGEDSFMVIGQQKGRDTKERMQRNFGMTRPEGYRKAQRLMALAERFGVPVVTFIDTPGAYPGIDAEEHGQSQAIGSSLSTMSALATPVVSFVIGEGGSGGALALGVADRVFMLENAVYSVISPEGCAAILFKDSDKAPLAAQALGLTAPELLDKGLIDAIVPEAPGGAHRDGAATAANIKKAILEAMAELKGLDPCELVQRRYAKWQSYGAFALGASSATDKG